MGSVPFGGRYRLIDFPLSNMVNSGISTVGIITKSNYRSLMDHIGTGKPWDLSRKRAGMFFLPPFSSAGSVGVYRNRIESLQGSLGFINRSNEEFVVMCVSNVICNLDFECLLSAHTKTGADITIAYKHGNAPKLDDSMTFAIDSTGRITNTALYQSGTQDADYSLNIFIFRKALLERLINEAASLNYTDFEQDIIRRNTENLKIYGYEYKGFSYTLDGLQSYYDANMELLKMENRTAFFTPERPVYTKLRDDMPAIYGVNSHVKNSLVADGCKIEGEVENCILFRRVNIGKGAKVKNSIIMQDTFIGENADLNCVITDKNVVIKPDKILSGAENYPLFVGKGIVV
jgi:glucose-1-phosphate adenylyltransferase